MHKGRLFSQSSQNFQVRDKSDSKLSPKNQTLVIQDKRVINELREFIGNIIESNKPKSNLLKVELLSGFVKVTLNPDSKLDNNALT